MITASVLSKAEKVKRRYICVSIFYQVSQIVKINLTLSRLRPLSYRNLSIDLLCKSMDWFLYDNGLRHDSVKSISYVFLYRCWCIWNPHCSLETKDAIHFIFRFSRPYWSNFKAKLVSLCSISFRWC